MIILIQEHIVNYLNASSVISISHNTRKRDATVEYDNGGKVTYFNVEEIRFTEERL